MTETRPSQLTTSDADARIRELEATLARVQTDRDQLQRRFEALRVAYDDLLRELALLKRQLFVAKAERVDTKALQLEFDLKIQQANALAQELGITAPADEAPTGGDAPTKPEEKSRPKPKGRRDLKALELPERRIDVPDPVFEALVAEGKAEFVRYEESTKLGYERGGMRRIVIRRPTFRVIGNESGEPTLRTTEMPPQLMPRCLAAPSLLAHVVTFRFDVGVPLNRQEALFAREGTRIDRGTMCRWVDDLGATFDSSIVQAMREHARNTAMCIASDATGIPVQPGPRNGGPRQACRRGHYFVMIADRDHIWFEYTPKENSAAVAAMFEGYSGYVQVDAKSVFDVLFNDPPPEPPDDGERPSGRIEVGCWAHARRKYWEAAAAHSAVAREALARIHEIFKFDAAWRGRPPAEIKRLRHEHLRKPVQDFFAWATAEYEKIRDIRGPLRSALGYSVRQKGALTRFLDNGRLRLDNNPSELQLRGGVVLGRKVSLFVGGDDHAENAAGIMSLVASARLHKLDPETYLRDMIRVLPHWPRGRYLELAPKFWADTRARLVSAELDLEIGRLTIPPPSQQQTPPG